MSAVKCWTGARIYVLKIMISAEIHGEFGLSLFSKTDGYLPTRPIPFKKQFSPKFYYHAIMFTRTCEQTCEEVFPLLPKHLCYACYRKGYRHSKAELEQCLALDFRSVMSRSLNHRALMCKLGSFSGRTNAQNASSSMQIKIPRDTSVSG